MGIPEARANRRDLLIAESLARRAGRLLVEYATSGDLGTSEKGPKDVVTFADKASEEMLVSELKAAFPNDGVVGEEGARSEGAHGRVWYIDPLDGTFNFSREIPFWCVSIGLAVDGNPEVGAVYDPSRDELFSGGRGLGTTLNGRVVSARGPEGVAEATVQINVDFDREGAERSLADTTRVGMEAMRLRNMGSLALELAYVACGRLDALIQRGSHPWDYAAGIILCLESGATVTSRDGSPFDLARPDALVAATLPLHENLLKLLHISGHPPSAS